MIRAQVGGLVNKALNYFSVYTTGPHARATARPLHRRRRIMAVARGRNREPRATVLASETSRGARRPAASAICRGWVSLLYLKKWARLSGSMALPQKTNPF